MLRGVNIKLQHTTSSIASSEQSVNESNPVRTTTMIKKNNYHPLYTRPREDLFKIHLISTQLNALLNQQRGYAKTLRQPDMDVFYSRTDLRMFIDQRKEMARKLLLNNWTKQSDQFIFHTAIFYKVNAPNLRQLMADYAFCAELVDACNHYGATPLHLLAASVGGDQIEQLNELLIGNQKSFRRACGIEDCFGFVPLVVAIISVARLEAIETVLDLFPAAVAMPYSPTSLARNEDVHDLNGFFPWQIACCCHNSVDIIYSLLRADASRVQSGAN